MEQSFPPEEMQEILQGFVEESQELLQQIDDQLLVLEQQPRQLEAVHELFRAFHTIKGICGFFGLDPLADLTHLAEELLNQLRHGRRPVDQPTLDLLAETREALAAMIARLQQGTLELPSPKGLLNKLKKHLSTDQSAAHESPQATESDRDPPDQAASQNGQEVEHAESLEEPHPPQVPFADQLPDSTVRVDVKRLDTLMNLVGELVLVKNRFAQFLEQFGIIEPGNGFLTDLAELSHQFEHITGSLQEAVMNTRMLPIGKVFQRFPRLVRELAREFNKQVEVVIEGQDTELDKSVVEAISDPLVHLVRNCIDHGIEPPEERQRKGKPARGRIHLTARHQGNFVLVEVSDDGRGLNPVLIKEKAVEKGIITPERAAQMSTSDAYNLIFRPGFSTAQQVSQLSGRGVGMDVVKSNISRLNGMIVVQSAPGKGTRFTLKLPLTLAIVQCILIGVGEQRFALPMSSVMEIRRVRRSELSQVHNRQVMSYQGKIIPIVHLAELFDVPDIIQRQNQFYVLILGVPGHAVGMAVERLFGQQECVVKPLGPLLGQIKGLGGSTVLGDGRVVMILDVGEIINLLKLNAVEFSG